MKLIRYLSPSKQVARAPGGGFLSLSKKKTAGLFTTLVVVSNIVTYALFTPGMLVPSKGFERKESALYLMDKASIYVLDAKAFERKVRKVARKLKVPPEWLMAVMYSESRFDASVKNFKGSGATGLIQFMPITAKDLNTTVEKLRNLNHVEQMDYVYEYLKRVRKKYGDFKSLTDLYLAILYPRAIGKDVCYSLYGAPSKAYHNNKGLDENKDGHVTVSDIDRRMQRIFPTAFAARNAEEGEE